VPQLPGAETEAAVVADEMQTDVDAITQLVGDAATKPAVVAAMRGSPPSPRTWEHVFRQPGSGA